MRLIERARDVLVSVDVHAVLATDSCVDLPEQGGRDESETQSPHIGRCGESRDVGDDSAADAQHEGRTVDARFQEFAVDGRHRLQGLDAFAFTDEHGGIGCEQFVVEPVDCRVGDGCDATFGEDFRKNFADGTDVDSARRPDDERSVHRY